MTLNNTSAIFHCYFKDDVTYLVVTKTKYPSNKAFAFLKDIEKRFNDHYSNISNLVIDKNSLNNEFQSILKSRMKYYMKFRYRIKKIKKRRKKVRMKDIKIEIKIKKKDTIINIGSDDDNNNDNHENILDINDGNMEDENNNQDNNKNKNFDGNAYNEIVDGLDEISHHSSLSLLSNENDVEQQRRRKRKRIVLLIIAFIVLMILVFGIVIGMGYLMLNAMWKNFS